jgi:hypothetical protein
MVLKAYDIDIFLLRKEKLREPIFFSMWKKKGDHVKMTIYDKQIILVMNTNDKLLNWHVHVG